VDGVGLEVSQAAISRPDLGDPYPQAGLDLSKTLQSFTANHGQTYRGRALLVENFQRAETAKPVPPPSRAPITGVNCQRTRAAPEESNSLCSGDASVDERKVFVGPMRDPAKPVPPPSRTPITGVAVKRARAEESNGRRGKPRSKFRFHLAFPLTKLSRNRLSTVLGWNIFLASFKLVIPVERLEGL
ncbi:hypothetical protein THAOC_09678, partial [Thalassiosira oceanica]